MTASRAVAFIRANTVLESPALVPEVRLYLASEITPIWQASETELAEAGVPPPFWAFAWAGGQALARHILDHPELVSGKRVLDFGAGSGLVGIASALAGAALVTAAEIDPFACAAIALNAVENGVEIAIRADNVIGSAPDATIILAGDMCYERPLAESLTRWLRLRAAAGVLVLIGDAGRNYLPGSGLERIAAHAVPTSLELEDNIVRESIVWRVRP